MIGRLVGVLFAALSPTAAWGQCQTMDQTGVQEALGHAEESLANADLRGGKRQLKALFRNLTCVETRVPSEHLARFGRAMSLASFYSQDDFAVKRWAGLTWSADPDVPWPEAMGPGHPFRDKWEQQERPALIEPEGLVLAVPRGGAVFLDGHLLLEPVASSEVPHLVQVFDKKNTLIKAYWQDGAAFPDALIAKGEGLAPVPRWYEGEVPEGATRGGPGFPVVPVAIAGGLAVAAGALYGGAAVSAASLPDAEGPDEVTAVRTRTNALVVSSAAVGLGAVGVGVTGFLVHSRF